MSFGEGTRSRMRGFRTVRPVCELQEVPTVSGIQKEEERRHVSTERPRYECRNSQLCGNEQFSAFSSHLLPLLRTNLKNKQ